MKLDEVNINLASAKITLSHQDPLSADFLSKASAIAFAIEDGVTIEALPVKGQGNTAFPYACQSDSKQEQPPEHENAHSPQARHDQSHRSASSPIRRQDMLLLAAALLLFLTGLIAANEALQLALLAASYLLAGKNVFLKTARRIRQGKLLDENVLMLLASCGAFVIGAYAEGAVTMLLYVIGEYIQDYSIYRSQKSISDLMQLKPQTATIWSEAGTRVAEPENVAVGDILLILPGEKIALDGVVIEGSSYIDNSALTGESLPIACSVGSEVLSGGLVKDGAIKIKVTKPYADSTIAKMLDMIANAAGKKSTSERLLTRFAAYYTPAVVLGAVLLTVIPVLFFREALSVWIYRSFVFLAASCPCSLIISIPLTYFAGLGKASRQGILIKGANYLEALSKTDRIIFDKTGTLTKGNFAVIKISPEASFTKEELLSAAALTEKYSKHPIGQSIKTAYGKELPDIPVDFYKEIGGKGVAMEYQGDEYLCGNFSFMQAHHIAANEQNSPYTLIYAAKNGMFLGTLTIADELKPEAADSIAALQALGLTKLQMFTGDQPDIAKRIGKQIGISEIEAGMLPADKYEKLLSLLSDQHKIAFVGDGINDASVIKAADIGIAMGNLGSDIAVESADIILSNDKLSALVEAFHISRKTDAILKQNLVLSLGFKLAVLVLGSIGLVGMWAAIFADVGIMLIASLNALRAGR